MERNIRSILLVTKRGEMYGINTEFTLENFSLIIQSSPSRSINIGDTKVTDIIKVVDEETGEYKYTVTNIH